MRRNWSGAVHCRTGLHHERHADHEGPDTGGFQIQTREPDNSYDDTAFDVVVG